MKGTLLEGRSSFSSVSHPPLQWYNWNITPSTRRACAAKSAGFVVWIPSIRKGTLLGGRCSLSSVSRLSLQHCNWNVTPITTHAYNQPKFGRNRSVTKGTLLLWTKEFLVPISTTMASGRPKGHTWYSLHTHYSDSKFSRNRSVKKGTLVLWSIQFFVCISTTTASVRLTRHTWHSLHALYNQPNLARIRSVK
jgi:hypothetical protein